MEEKKLNDKTKNQENEMRKKSLTVMAKKSERDNSLQKKLNRLTVTITNPKYLEYKDIISRKIPITARPFYTCKICQAKFPMEYVEAWNCPRCGYDYYEKCFIETGGKII